MRSLFDTIWRMCYWSNRTLDHSSPWEPIWIQSTHSNRHSDLFSWTHQNWWQKIKECSKKICAMLADALSGASALRTRSRYRIHRTRISNAVTTLSQQRCVYYCKKSTVQCCVWKNAPNSGKCYKNTITWLPPRKILPMQTICRWSIINCYAYHASRSTLHLRQQPRQSCFSQRHVSQHSIDCRLARHHTKKRTSYPWEPHERKPEKKGLQLCSPTNGTLEKMEA